MKRNPYIVVLVAGSSNGGKTSVTTSLVNEFPNSMIIKQDDYFFHPDHKNHQWIKLKSGASHQQWEIYSSIDWSSFDKNLYELHNQLIDESSCKKFEKTLDFVKQNVKLILIEGHILLNHKMPKFFNVDRKFFLTLSKDVSCSRRQTRNYDPPDPEGYFDEYVWPSYLDHLEYAQQNYTDVIFISGELDRKSIFNRIKKEIDDTTEDERQAIRARFKAEGLDENMPDDKKFIITWRWLLDAEANWMSTRHQNEKLYKQQEADLKEVEEYIEKLWAQSNSRLMELQNENRLLKQEIYKIKLSKPTDFVLDTVNNNRRNSLLNIKQENGDLLNTQSNDQQKENKKSAFSNVKQMFIKNTNNKEQNVNAKQLNLENELRFLYDKCREIENEKKRLETENENLVFKLNETLAICDVLESNKTSVQLARNSKSFYELRQATSEYRLNKLEKDKLTTSKTMNFKAINNDDNKSTSGIDSSSSQDKESKTSKLDQLKETSPDKQNKSNLNVNQQDSGRESTSTLTDSRTSKDSREFDNKKEIKEELSYQDAQNALRLMNAVREECAILKKELIAKEKQLIIQDKQIHELQLKYDKRKFKHREQMQKLKTHIERETKRWEIMFNKAKQKTNDLDQNIVQSSNVHLVDSL